VRANCMLSAERLTEALWDRARRSAGDVADLRAAPAGGAGAGGGRQAP